jgi:hypothetical protein
MPHDRGVPPGAVVCLVLSIPLTASCTSSSSLPPAPGPAQGPAPVTGLKPETQPALPAEEAVSEEPLAAEPAESPPAEPPAASLAPAAFVRHGPVAAARRGAAARRLTDELSGELHASFQLLRWCDARDPAAARAAGCDELRASAAQAGSQVAWVTAHGQTKVHPLQVSLAALQAHMGTVRVQEQTKGAADEAAGAQAADSAARALSGGSARRSLPEWIPVHASAVAVVTLEHPPSGPQLGRLSARLTVVQGDAIQVVGLRTIRPAQPGGALRWEWTLQGSQPGQVDVRTELLLAPPPGAAAGQMPVAVQTWQDHITVPAGTAGSGVSMRSVGLWLLLSAAAAAVVLTGVWLLRRHPDSI